MCPFKDSECFYCHRKGHTIRKCRQKERNDKPRTGKNSTGRRPVHQLVSEHEFDNSYSEAKEFEMLNLYKLGESRVKPLLVTLHIEGTPLKMEIDTGASMSVMSEKMFRELVPERNIQPSTLYLRTFTGEIVSPIGSAKVYVEYQNQKMQLPLIVVPGDTPSLMGRNWLKNIQLDWPTLFKIEQPVKLNQIIKQHEAVFKS